MRLAIVSVLLCCFVALIAVTRVDARALAWSFSAPAAPALEACDAGQAPAPAADHDLRLSPSLTSDLITAEASSDEDQGQRPVAFETSEAYKTRARIHKIASFATLPLVGSELVLGESLYNSSSNSTKSAHIAVGSAIVGLFAVNTVTGAWNLWESRTNPAGRTKRLVHGLLMLASDAGFAATAMTGPGNNRNAVSTTFDSQKSMHRTIAITSISLATAGYLFMLIGAH